MDRLPGHGPHGDCHLWTASRDRQGYGKTSGLLAHRVAWELVNGPIPEGMCVLHRCDNPPCCRVQHLFLGTRADNNADREAKGRGVYMNGSALTQSKLAEADIPVIRKDLAEGMTYGEIGRRFGVTAGTIWFIAKGKTWTHVKGGTECGFLRS